MKQITISKLVGIVVFVVLYTTCHSCTKDEKEEVYLTVTPTYIEFEAGGGDTTIQISSNTAWSINNSSEWCSESVNSGEGNQTVTLTALANEDTATRSVTISVSADEIIREVAISQKGKEEPEFVYDIPPDDTDIRELTSVELTQLMGVGWNIGNSLDATEGETSWGNPLISQTLIDSVKAAGFNSIRLPVAWSKFSDESTYTIETSWMERVEEVVNYILNNNMYVVMNIHWDGGWMQPTYEQEEYVNDRLAAMWKQIATHFRDYNDYLLFAGTNEVMVEGNYGAPTAEYAEVQNGFNQTFVTTVRKTGGRNAYRHLVVQGFNTNIDYTVDNAVIPTDVVEHRLMMEVHYYDPYDFTLNSGSDNISQWGMNATDPAHTQTWANEDYADAQFQKMKTNFVDKGYGVILGEYGAISRLSVDHHHEYRRYYLEYITQSIVDHELVPFYWDNGYTSDHGLGIFNRSTGEQYYSDLIEAITSAEM